MDSISYPSENQSTASLMINDEKHQLKNNEFIQDMASLNLQVQELEYDEEFGSDLVAEQGNSRIGNGQLTSDSLIEDDYEAELGTAQVTYQESIMESNEVKKKNAITERIDRLGIVNVCGSDSMGRPIILISAARLPDSETILKDKEFFASHQHFFDTLLEVISSILEQYVESEYTLIYLHHGLKSSSQPSLNYIAKVYKMLDRKFKKNLKAFFIVHPTMFIKLLINFISPLTSSKFKKKMMYCNTLEELGNHVDLEILKIPDEVKQYNSQLKKRSSSFQRPKSQDNLIEATYGPFQQFKVSLETISKNNNGDCIPLCIKEAVVFLKQNLNEEGIFRKSGSLVRIKEIQNLYNMGQPVAYADHEVHVAACVLKAFFRELPESLLPEIIFNEVMSLQALDLTDKVEVAKDLLNAKLPTLNYKMLKFLTEFLSEVASHSSTNKMDAKNISYVFGPNFLRPKNGIDYGLIDVERINNFVELLIKYHSEIFYNNSV